MGKKVKALRRQGIIPANLYGRGIDSASLQAPLDEFRRIFRAVPRNSVVNLKVADEPDVRPVILRDVQRNPVTGDIQHVELFQIDISRPIQSDAQLVLIGSAEPQSQGGVIVQNFDSVRLEALPLEMPDRIQVDISVIKDFGQAIHVSDLLVPENVRILTDQGAVVVTVVAPRLTAEDEAEEAAREAEAADVLASELEPGGDGEGASEAASDASGEATSS